MLVIATKLMTYCTVFIDLRSQFAHLFVVVVASVGVLVNIITPCVKQSITWQRLTAFSPWPRSLSKEITAGNVFFFLTSALFQCFRTDRIFQLVLVFLVGSAGRESACNVGYLGLIPGLGRCPGEGNGTHSSILAWRIPWTV